MMGRVAAAAAAGLASAPFTFRLLKSIAAGKPFAALFQVLTTNASGAAA
jgi:hypothetical protein|tara:strand:+ start:504 stop:650 length:147 start_codon:yes stop_codon:yes gene_type:complete